MRKHLFVTLLLTCGMPFASQYAMANPEPQSQSQGMITVQGTVLDENDEPVIGASVTPKGSKQGAATDAFGHFTLKVKAGTMLNVSFVGYKSEAVKATENLTVYLVPTTEQLNSLVVVGYGTQKKADLTGAVATVDVARVMDSRPVQDVAKALQGSVPGLTITTSSGDIAANPKISIRGLGTLSTSDHSSNPLIVVDGVPVDDMSFLNPEDIAEISVLKDAASSSIYGTRAAFGVILITTKNAGTKDRVSVNYTNNFSWGQATMLPTPNSTVEQLKVAMLDTNPGGDTEIFGMYYNELLPFAEAWAKQHNGPYKSYCEMQPFVNTENVGDYYMFPSKSVSPFTGEILTTDRFMCYADWDVKSTMFRTAPGQKHNVSLEGTSGNTHYRVSFGYDSKEGLNQFNPDKLHRYMANANIDTQIFKWLKAGARFSFSDREYSGPNLQRNSYQYMWRFPSFFEMYGWIRNDDGEKQSFRNDITIRQNSHIDKTVNTQTRMQGWMNAEIIPGLNLQADFTYNLLNQDSDAAVTPYYGWNNWTPGSNKLGSWAPYTQATSYAAQSHYKDDTWTANIYATYQKTFAKDYNLKVMAGWTAEQEEYNYFYAKRTGLLDYNLPNLNLTNGTNYTTSATDTHRATTGFFGRVNFDYKGIYLFEANGRYDASSKFPANDQWAFFPSFSAGYRFSEEGYFKPVKDTGILTNGKIRASYGHIGNEAVGTDRFLSTVSQIAAGSVTWLNGTQKITEFSMPTLVQSSLTWERIVTTDVGLDLGFLNNELTLGFDWYQRDTKDMLGPGAEAPQVLGAGAPYGNNGSLRTRGWELSLNWNHSFGDANVYATFSLGDARTKITKWHNTSGILYSYRPEYNSYYTEGLYYGDIYGFETDRYFTMDDFNKVMVPGKNYDTDPNDYKYEYQLKDGIPSQKPLESGSFHYGPGDIKFKDLNGDGKIDAGKGTKEDHGDLKVIGNAMPRYEYSFRLGGSWKGFDLDLFFQGVGKRNLWATGSTVTPQVQSALGTFTNQQVGDFNHVKYDAHNSIIEDGYYVSESNKFPRVYCAFDGTGQIANIGQGKYNYYPQSKYLMNLAYLRMKNLTFGYTLPYSITKHALIQKARVYFSGENLFFLYNGAGKYQLDPEQTASAGSSVDGYNSGQGMYGRTTPQQRVYSFGIQVTF